MTDHFANVFPSNVRPSLGWWVVYTRHQHEKSVADMLAAKGLEVYLPVYETIRRWKDRNKRLVLPLFPSYLFVKEMAGGRLATASTPGVHNILTRGNSLSVIPAEEMNAIQRALAEPSRVEPHPFLQCGERVRVTRGALEGVEGILVRKKNLCRLVILVEMISQAAAVEVEGSDVEPVKLRKPPATHTLDPAQLSWHGQLSSVAAAGFRSERRI